MQAVLSSEKPENPSIAKLLQAAEGEFGKSGYAATRLEDIAAIAGLKRSSLLYHFKSKEELYSAVVRLAFSKLAAALALSMQQSLPFAQRLDRLVESLNHFLSQHQALARVLLRDLLDGQGPARQLMLTEMLPLVEQTEEFMRRDGQIPADVPLRSAIMMLVSAALMRTAAGPVATALWAGGNHDAQLARRLLVHNPQHLPGHPHGSPPSPQHSDRPRWNEDGDWID